MTQKILFPVDFSPSSVAMAAYVKRAAEIFCAEVSVIHVCDFTSYSGFELYARPSNEIAEEHWNIAKSKLEHFLEAEFSFAKHPRILSAGDTASVIAETAKKRKIDLIVMPTHAGRFRRMLLGSTTAKVLNDAECPVLTTEHAETIAPRPLEHRQWVCAIGLSENSERVLRYAKDIVEATGANLTVMYAVQSDEEELRARRRLAEVQSQAGSDAAVFIAKGPVKEALLDAARELSADVLVIGRSPHAGALGRMRDLTYSLIRDSPCPVLSV